MPGRLDVAVVGRGPSVWSRATGEPREEPIPLQTFLRSADWLRRTFVAESDPPAWYRSTAPAGRPDRLRGGRRGGRAQRGGGGRRHPFAHAPPRSTQLGARRRIAGRILPAGASQSRKNCRYTRSCPSLLIFLIRTLPSRRAACAIALERKVVGRPLKSSPGTNS